MDWIIPSVMGVLDETKMMEIFGKKTRFSGEIIIRYKFFFKKILFKKFKNIKYFIINFKNNNRQIIKKFFF